MPIPIKKKDPKKNLIILGARQHNLRDLEIVVPKKKLVVFTGPSGSGKSSLAFDTIYAEGRRRYIESLSIYARQFLGAVEKPDFDQILGLSPTISIEQKTSGNSARSTVGTITEIYDHMRILFAQLGTQHCFNCNEPVSAVSIESIVADIICLPEKTRFVLLAPMIRNRKGEFRDMFDKLRKSGFSRARIDGETVLLEDVVKLERQKKHNIDIVVDRLIAKEGIQMRVQDAVERAMTAGNGQCVLLIPKQNGVEEESERLFSRDRACQSCGTGFESLTHQSFSFNSPIGQCKKCRGLGTLDVFQSNLMIDDDSKSIYDGAILAIGLRPDDRPKKFPVGNEVDPIWRKLEALAKEGAIDLNRPWKKLPKKQKTLLLDGRKGKEPYRGLLYHINKAYERSTKKSALDFFGTFLEKEVCPECEGARLRKEMRCVRFRSLSIDALCAMSIDLAIEKVRAYVLSPREKKIGGDLVSEISERLDFLHDVGLGYLSLSRSADTLSGGETQRIRLASQLGTKLRGVLYVLDEPSIGLHQRDNHKLIASLEGLRDRGNSVIVVEHDRDTMEAADYIVDFGPGAGVEGGAIVAQGTFKQVRKAKSGTGLFLSGKRCIPFPSTRRKSKKSLKIKGATHHNLKNINIDIPLRAFVCVTGVSGAGKSSLVNEIIYPAIARKVFYKHRSVGNVKSIKGLDAFDKVIVIDQSPIGRTPRSNPATYTKVFDQIRSLFAQMPEAKMYGFNKGRFSFNVDGGRCDECKGAGAIKVEMNFLANVFVPCEMCGGKRFNHTTLMVKYREKNIAEVLDMTISDASVFFKAHPKIKRVMDALNDVGLGYVKLGQPSTTLSGGEAQRIKLSRELSKIATGDTLYILDEPSTGLHFEDINRLMDVITRLVDAGNSVLMIEHNLEIIACADYVIDMGPEGGDEGGYVVAKGTPEEVAEIEASYTGQFLKSYFASFS